MQIEKATKADSNEIMKLFSACVKHMRSNNIFQWNEQYPNIHFVKEDIENECLYFIKEEGLPSAVITLNEDQPDEYSDVAWKICYGSQLVIHRLAVHPNYHNKGLASQMVSFAEQLAARKGYTAIRLDTYSQNYMALKLYEKLGYSKVGQIYFKSRPDPFICFEKPFE